MILTEDAARKVEEVEEYNHPGRSRGGAPIRNGRESKFPLLEAVMDCLAHRLT